VATILLGVSNAAMAEVETRGHFTCYVAQNGDDRWSGTLAEPNAAKTDGPFASLERARDEVRRVGRARSRKVVVRGGTYRIKNTFVLSKEDSGTEGDPVVWQAAPGEEVGLSAASRCRMRRLPRYRIPP